MEITKDIRYIGVNDHDIDLFEGQYDVSENGMAYNSYVILGDKIAVADSVDAGFVDEWLGNLETVLDGRTPDYLVVHHMEPDHSAGIAAFMERYPQAQIVASMGAFRMMVNYFGTDFPERKMVVKDGDAVLASNGVRAGSTLTLAQALRNIVAFTDHPVQDVIPLMTANPARALRMDDRKGSIEVGKDADMVLLDDALNVVTTVGLGRVIYTA